VPLNYTTQLGPIDRLKNDLALKARRRVFSRFMAECRPTPTDRVADFGVSGHRDHPAHYFFESLFPYKQQLTAIGQSAEDADWFPEQFPGLTFLEADLRSIPLPNNYFEAGICNAVVEHAGERDAQAALVKEVCRVCRRALFTTPNKAFPVELHTFLPLVHWLPDPTFRRILRTLGYGSLARVDDLNPLAASAFLSLFPSDRSTRLLHTGLPLVLSTNLLALSVAAT
jgi:SAM-dependent methyltransferase